jgi:hypothetical protein
MAESVMQLSIGAVVHSEITNEEGRIVRISKSTADRLRSGNSEQSIGVGIGGVLATSRIARTDGRRVEISGRAKAVRLIVQHREGSLLGVMRGDVRRGSARGAEWQRYIPSLPTEEKCAGSVFNGRTTFWAAGVCHRRARGDEKVNHFSGQGFFHRWHRSSFSSDTRF